MKQVNKNRALKKSSISALETVATALEGFQLPQFNEAAT